MEKLRRVLVVDDEPKILEVLCSFLKSRGFGVVTAGTGREALAVLEQQPVAMVLLDLMLPDIGGEEVCAAIRRRSQVPVIMVTAKVEEADLLRGLGVGADDYITKPFSLNALHARMEAVLRRAGGSALRTGVSFGGGDLEIDLAQHVVKKRGSAVALTPNEFKLLAGLVRYPAKVFTREEIIHITLGPDYGGYDRTIDSHIKNLRRKIETDPRNPVYIKTVRGVGYKFGGE